MIILNTVNHENNKIEYHFSHDDFKGVVFKILANFDVIQEDDGEHYLTCNYENLNHNFNGLEVSEIDAWIKSGATADADKRNRSEVKKNG